MRRTKTYPRKSYFFGYSVPTALLSSRRSCQTAPLLRGDPLLRAANGYVGHLEPQLARLGADLPVPRAQEELRGVLACTPTVLRSASASIDCAIDEIGLFGHGKMWSWHNSTLETRFHLNENYFYTGLAKRLNPHQKDQNRRNRCVIICICPLRSAHAPA